MANTYTQIHIQAIFAVQNRQSLIQEEWEEKLYKFITGIIQNHNHNHKMLQINGMPDHIHLFFGLRPNQSISDIIKVIKSESSKWINNQGFTRNKFSWQAGYGAFSYAKSQVPHVIRYIQNKKVHHEKKTFREEYLAFLKAFEIQYDERFIFTPVN